MNCQVLNIRVLKPPCRTSVRKWEAISSCCRHGAHGFQRNPLQTDIRKHGLKNNARGWKSFAPSLSRQEVSANGLISLGEGSSRDDDTALPSSAPTGADTSVSSSSDGEGGVKIDLELPRRSLQVFFTCNLCNGRTERLVNPIAWKKGMVIAQCANCQAWHKLADEANLVEEIRYADLEE